MLLLIAAPALLLAEDAERTRADDARLFSLARSLPLDGRLLIEALELEALGPVELDLERFRVFAEDVVILSGDRRLEAPSNAYFRGFVAGVSGSKAVLSFKNSGRLDGLVSSQGELWRLSGGAGSGRIEVQKLDILEEHAARPFECQADQLSPPESLLSTAERSQNVDSTTLQGLSYSYTARVAVDTDWEFLQKFGGNVAAGTDYVGDLFAYSSAIYEAEVDTSLYISFLQWWPGANSGSDPWTQSGCSGALSEFRSYWISNRGGVERTVAHLMSGKSTGCGIAYLGVLCSNSYGYGVTGSLSGAFDPADPTSSSGFWDILALSHEIGHNFGSPHTHCYGGIGGNPQPVDTCYGSEPGSGCYQGTPSLPAGCSPGDRCGTIMSYCHLRSGGYGNITLTFGQGHPHGVEPGRVPVVMNAEVVNEANFDPACLEPIIPDIVFEDGFESGSTGSWTQTVQ